MFEWCHENPEKLHVNTEENRAYYIPYPVEDFNSAMKEEPSKAKILLNGEWGFRFYNGIYELPENFYLEKQMDYVKIVSLFLPVGRCMVMTIINILM